jgi:hypothetical protein
MSVLTPSLTSRNDFEKTPQGIQQLWITELAAAKKDQEKWRKAGERITKVFLDERGEDGSAMDILRAGTRLNVFSANIITLRALLFGNVPRVEVGRRYQDSDDDAARVASEIMERSLNADIGEQFSFGIGQALDDRLLVGYGCARVAYEADFETIQHEAIMLGERELAPAFEEEKKSNEASPVYYYNWRDVLWSPARTWDEVRWIGFRNYLTRDECKARFGDKIGEAMPLGKEKRKQTDSGIQFDPWQKSEVWEVWDRTTKKVIWMCEGMDVICDMKDDTLKLKGFFPCPKFMLANPTSKAYLPRADYILAQDQYNELNDVSRRITMLQKALKVVGVYDKSAEGIQRMLNEATENTLIPVDSWAMFAEKGGIKGQVDWLPLDQVVAALMALRDYRTELVNLLYQVTGMSDILRGATVAGETATAQSIKAKFASVRVQAQQDEFARFATDLQKLRAEVMINHFSDEALVKQANMEFTPDQQHVPAALELLRSKDVFRIGIKSEQLAMQDMAALRQEKTEFIQGLSGFISASAPLIQQHPAAAPTLLELLKWAMSGFRGASTAESILDQAIASLQQNPPQQPPDPAKAKAEEQKMKTDASIGVEKIKQQGKQQEIGMNLQADLTRVQAETGAELTKQKAQFAFDTRSQAVDAMNTSQQAQRDAGVRAAEQATKNKRPVT